MILSLKNMANSVSSKRGTFTNSYPVIVNSIEPNRYIFEVNKLEGNYHNFPPQNLNLKELNNTIRHLMKDWQKEVLEHVWLTVLDLKL